MKTNLKIKEIIFGLLLGLLPVTIVCGQESDSLQYYIGIAIENNPRIKAEDLTHQAMLERIQQAGALMDPEFSTGIYAPSMDVLGGRSVADFTLMQSFPWFGSQKAAKKEAEMNAGVQKEQYYEVVNELVAEVRMRWYEMEQMKEEVRNIRANRDLLEQLEQLTLRKYSVSKPGSSGPGMSDVLRIQMEIAELDNNAEIINAGIDAAKIKFNALLNRGILEPVNLSGRIIKNDFLRNDEWVTSAIETNNPLLKMIVEEQNVIDAKAEKEKKMSNPTFGVGVQYMLLGKTNDPMFAMGDMNGKDMVMPMVSVSLPIFRNKYKAQQKENELMKMAAQENFNNTLNLLKGEYYELKNQLDNEERKIALYDNQTELAETTYNLIVKEFTTGKSDLTDVLQIRRQLLDFQLKKAEAISEYNKIVVQIQKLLAEKN